MAPSHSMSDGIDSDLCSLSYSTIEHVAGMATIYATEAYSPRLTLSGQMHYVPLCYERAIIIQRPVELILVLHVREYL